MKAAKYISKKEHKLLLIVVFSSFLFFFFDSIGVYIYDYNQNIEKEQQELLRKATAETNLIRFSEGFKDIRPWANIPFIASTFFSFLSLKQGKKYLLSCLFTGIAFLHYVKWFFNLSYEIWAVYYLYYLIFFFVSMLFFWQITILIRIFNKTRQDKISIL